MLTEHFIDDELTEDTDMPSRNHSLAQMNIGSEIRTRYREKLTVFSKLSLELNGKGVTPDLCIYPKMRINWLDDEITVKNPPLLIIEILSPTQSFHNLVRRLNEYFLADVTSCWLAQPTINTVTVFTPDMKPTIFSSGDVHDPVVNIRIPLAHIF